MKKLAALLGLAAGMATMSGCAMAGPGMVYGTIYSGYTIGGGVGAGTGNKVGSACAMSILGVIAVGDASIDAAKKDAGITNVANVDHESFGILGIYANVCTKVTGS